MSVTPAKRSRLPRAYAIVPLPGRLLLGSGVPQHVILCVTGCTLLILWKLQRGAGVERTLENSSLSMTHGRHEGRQ